jgi:serine/threonine-protein phosphatase 6 regulatory subunit 3
MLQVLLIFTLDFTVLQKPPVRTTVGALDPPLGNTRLQVAKLIAALLATNSSDVNKELANLGTTDVLLVRFLLYFMCRVTKV